ncbi:pilus assembly PilX family protein [Undibacterium oligocarboniphilum]|uniref:Type 4 fimbrial biogenesis protein PilX N-terminal domain-containing protein n=1 Tax=Undibacterium oligocarboniphilum TaxID=666702 RepID=A0A850QQN9_9BURK|nr:PilX N-terminal domain-containing pilus assembly protein [Undibacterium oligocarboniphilum]MBC3870495.1 hypothetical protein [Undibacterium oligocarboniphilum]NVO78704.1 hypothetical protein [Undibacterium oligocarboniphilum]
MMYQARYKMKHQRGATFLVSLVMLIVLTLLVVSAIRMGNANLKTVGNMQAKNEAAAAAQQAIETIMSNLNNFYTPVAQTISVDINNDGVPDYTVNTSAAVCLKMVPVEGYSVEFAQSAPKDTYWDIKAVVTDNRTGASVTLHQGAKVRMDATATCT